MWDIKCRTADRRQDCAVYSRGRACLTRSVRRRTRSRASPGRACTRCWFASSFRSHSRRVSISIRLRRLHKKCHGRRGGRSIRKFCANLKGARGRGGHWNPLRLKAPVLSPSPNPGLSTSELSELRISAVQPTSLTQCHSLRRRYAHPSRQYQDSI